MSIYSHDPEDRARARIDAAFREQRLAGFVLANASAHASERFHAADAQRMAWHCIEDARLALRGLCS